MQDRAESAIVLLLAVVEGVPVVLPQVVPAGFGYLWQAGFILLWGISVFWAFSLARLLSARLYRNQALGVGFVAVGWLAFDYSFFVSNAYLPNVAYPLALLLTFFWIDSSVLAARKSDPLYRNTLHWRELRWLLWPVLLGTLVAWMAGTVLYPAGFLIILPNGVSLSVSPLADVLVLTMFAVVAVSGPTYLLAAALRSKDRTLRRHLRWFALFAAFFFFFTLLGGSMEQPAFFGAAYITGTYCLYRSAKSLAPLNRLSLGRNIGKVR